MNQQHTSWILVEGSAADTIQQAVIEHSKIARPEVPQNYNVSIHDIGDNRFAVMFDPPAPPYAFANLIGWLHDARMCRGSSRAVGWLVAPGNGTRYFLMPDGKAGGDTLVGISGAGRTISLFLPDCSATRTKTKVKEVPEPELPAFDSNSGVTFTVTLDADTAFGNPDFDVA
jgi:hypothetical protein